MIVFLTVCTRAREPWLSTQENHQLLRAVWAQAASWLVGRYVVMPDHLHLFAAPNGGAHSLEAWVAFWKSLFSRRCGMGGRWQRDHWDTRLRHGESYASKWEYVRNNPVRHGLVTRAEDWPFQGELAVLPWLGL
ncbi:MAG: hypothetical protein HY904_17030 [Deltaproteobacteria bacterium]|nr:hypothetical protein [Deltaproteobacteria bacterium]